MKRFILLGVLAMTFTSCTALYNDYADKAYLGRFHCKYVDLSYIRVSNPDMIPIWLYTNIKYQSDGDIDHLDPLEQVLKQGYCDCEEFALLYLAILYSKFGVKGQFVLCDTSNRSVVTGGQANHAMVKVNGVLLDPRTGMVQDYRIAYIYDFDEIFY